MKNFRIHIALVIMIFLVSLLVSSRSYACGMNAATTQNVNHSNTHSEKSHKKDGCKTHSCKKHKNCGGCNGRCKGQLCRCAGYNYYIVSLPSFVEIELNLAFVKGQNQKYYFALAHISSGFFLIWSPPKIS